MAPEVAAELATLHGEYLMCFIYTLVDFFFFFFLA
jgi:hypothetical protein